jgi:hypothetical protein
VRKSNIVVIIIALIISMFLSSQNIVYADSQPKARTITIHLTQLSDEAYYVDLLVKIADSDKVYTAFNSENAERNGFDESDSYVAYENEGYISYSLHFTNADNDMKIKKYKSDQSGDIRADNEFIPFDYPDYDENFDLLMQYSPKIKVAILNEDKEVISVSDVGTLKKAKGYLTGGITYNLSSNSLNVDYYTPDNTFIIVLFVIGAIMVVLIAFIIRNIVNRRKRAII